MKKKKYFFFLFVCILSQNLLYAQTPPACTHYAAHNGTGSTCTIDTPCLVATFINNTTMNTTPGNVLCLNDGIYTGSNSMINIPTGFAGTSENRIWIRALNEGAALIDGQHGNRPLHTRGQFGTIWGINFKRGNNHVGFIGGDGWEVKRSIFYDTNDNPIGAVASMGGTNNLLEDCAAFGRGLKAVIAATGNAVPTGNIIRRCLTIWHDAGAFTTNPTNSAEVGYGQSNVIFENNVVTWNRTGDGSQPEGLFQFFRTDDSKALGNIFYIPVGAVFDASTLLFAATDGGSQQAVGDYQPTTNAVITHNLSYIDPGHTNFSTRRALRFDYTGPGPQGTNNSATANVGVSGLGLSCQSPSWTCTNNQQGTSLSAAIGSGNSVWTASNAAPGICKRYLNGTLTTDGLWPWPMNQRIIDAMAAAGRTPIDVTATMETLFGTIPEVCKTAGEPPEPPPSGGNAVGEVTTVRALLLIP